MRWRTLAGMSLLAILITAPRQHVSDPEGGGGSLRLCWCEVDPEGRVGPPLGVNGETVFVSMRNGQGRMFVIQPCGRVADVGFRSPG